MYGIILVSILPIVIGYIRSRLSGKQEAESGPTEEDYLNAARSFENDK